MTDLSDGRSDGGFDGIVPAGSMMAPGGAVAGFAPAPTGRWTTAAVAAVDHPADHVVILRLDVKNRIEHLPGQHYVVRLRADDGYTAQRSYSVASPPSDPSVELWIDRIPDGEVSPFLADEVRPGDELEVRGPIGGWFVWDAAMPAVGVAGGSGAVPLVAMLRHARALGRPGLLQLAVSARTLADLPFPDELAEAGRSSRSPAPATVTARRVGSLPRSCDRWPLATKPRSSAGRPASPSSPVGCWSTWAAPPRMCGSSDSAPAVDQQRHPNGVLPRS